MKVKLQEHIKLFGTQLDDLKRICKESHFSNFSEMGAGKSLPHAILAQGLIEDGLCDYVFIVCPKIVLGDWYKIFKNQLVCDTDKLVTLYHAPTAVRRFFKLRPIIILSYETITTDIEKFKLLAQAYRVTIIIDEAHKLRNFKVLSRKDKRKKADPGRTVKIAELTEYCRRVYLLTGTPITNGLKNAFSYIHIMRPGVYYRSFNHFKLNHMVYSPYDGRTLIGYKDVEKVQDILASFSVRHMKKEILDLPPVTFTTRLIDWDPAQKKYYKQMVDDCMVELQDSFLEATSAGARLIRLHQILTNPQQLGLDCDSTRWKVIEEDLESIDLTVHKVVILCHYRASVKRLTAQLAHLNPAVIFGGTVDIEKEKTKFNEDPTCRVMIGHPDSMGLGCNLTVAAYMFYFEYSWDLNSYDQTISRCNRPGQIYPLSVYNYAVRGGMEERKILPRLVAKKEFATMILRDKKEFIEFITLGDDDDLTSCNFS